MEKKVYKILKLVAVICAIVLLVEVIYIMFFLEKKSIYFDGINSVVSYDKYLVSVGSNNNNVNYYEKAKVTRYNPKKEKVFEKIYNKGFNGVYFDVLVDKNENIIAVGSFEKDEDEFNNKNRTALIVKYDKDGNIIYENDFQLLGNSKFTSVVEVEDGYIVAGQTIYDNMTVGLSEDGGGIIVKYNKNLDIVWVKNYGDNKSSVFNDVLVHKDYIYAVGLSNPTVGVVAKYSIDGEFINSYEYKDSDGLGFSGISYYNSHVFVCGGKINRENNDSNSVIISFTKDLELDKEVEFNGDGYDRFNQLIIDDDNNIVVVGTIALIDKNIDKNSANAFNHDGVIAKYDSNLEKIKELTYGDERDDYFTSIIDYDGNYLISGYSSYEDGSYLSKFIKYSYAFKVLGVE